MFKNKKRNIGLGLELKPGDEHYRAYVGPPKDFELGNHCLAISFADLLRA